MLCNQQPPDLSCSQQVNISHSGLIGFISLIKLQEGCCKCYLEGPLRMDIQDGSFTHKAGPQLDVRTDWMSFAFCMASQPDKLGSPHITEASL